MKTQPIRQWVSDSKRISEFLKATSLLIREQRNLAPTVLRRDKPRPSFATESDAVPLASAQVEVEQIVVGPGGVETA